MLKELTVTVVHDNNSYCGSLRTAWGFSAVVTGPENRILFDTGSDGTLLLENMAQLGIEPGDIDIVVLSHVHADHTGGLTGLLRVNPRVSVWLPEAFPARFKQVVQGYGAAVVEVHGPQEICPNVCTTGPMGRRIREQALVIRTERGLVVLTGCAHPGVEKIVERVAVLHGQSILLVMGGFHLEWATGHRMRRIAAEFGRLGVRHVAPTHCMGDKAREFFRQQYGNRYIDLGVGKTITLADLA